MENNIPIIAKKLWHMVRVVFFMLRKGISKSKLMMDLNMMLKQGKIAGKAISNLLHHQGSGGSSSSRRHGPYFSFPAPGEYEFSCSNTPNYVFPLTNTKRQRQHHKHLFKSTLTPSAQADDVVTVNAVKAVLEMLNNEVEIEASPALPGFGRSPLMVRPLRITDSPFPLRDAEESDNHVDEAAEKFIERFYKELRKQKKMAD